MSTVEDNEIGGSDAMPLRALDHLEVAKGYPDIRGWEATDANGERVGKIVELLVDTDALRVSQVLLDCDGTRRQVPVEAVQLQQDSKRAVISDLAAMREAPSHGDPRTDAVAAATGFRNEELIERASEPQAAGAADVEVERVPIMDGALRASDVAANAMRLPTIAEDALTGRKGSG
jgi:hypothetical protein